MEAIFIYFYISGLFLNTSNILFSTAKRVKKYGIAWVLRVFHSQIKTRNFHKKIRNDKNDEKQLSKIPLLFDEAAGFQMKKFRLQKN